MKGENMSDFKKIEFTNDHRYMVAHNPSKDNPNKVEVFLLTSIGYTYDGFPYEVEQIHSRIDKVTKERFKEICDLLDANEFELAKEKAHSIKRDLHPFNDPDLTGIFTSILLMEDADKE